MAAINTAAINVLQLILYQKMFSICISHSAAVGNEINLIANIAGVFISYLNIYLSMIIFKATAWLKSQTYAGVKAKILGIVRWFTFLEVGA